MNLLSSLRLKKRTCSFVALVAALAILFSFLVPGVISAAADNSQLYDFEKSGTAYIKAVQTANYEQESKYSKSWTTDKAATGTHSYRITTKSGASSAQYFFFPNTFNPDAGKWINLKVFVTATSGMDFASLFYKTTTGQIKLSDTYYFSQTTNTTDEIRSRDVWVDMSLQIPSGTSISGVGIYISSFATANDKADIYLDSYSITDKATDTIRYIDIDNVDIRRNFEGGNGSNYITNVQTANWAVESKYVSFITDEQASKGKKSLKIVTESGAAKAQYFYLTTSHFLPTVGKWMNIKIFVAENKGPDFVRLFYKENSGVIRTSEDYYFADNIDNPVVTDEIRKKNEWVTLSFFVPENASLSSCGVYTGSFGASNDTACFYLDDYTITDKALDTVRYIDDNDPSVKAGFEKGGVGDYISTVQTKSFGQEKNYSAAISSEQFAEGKKSLLIKTSSGADQMQYFFLDSFFRPDTSESSKWVNMKLFVDSNSDLASVRIFYQGYSGPIYYSDYYYFADNKESPVVTDSIRNKGEWINISMPLGKGTEMNSFGITTESFKASNDNCKLFLDSYSVDDYAADTIRYIDINNPEVRHGFESGTKTQYINQVQTNTWGQEKCYSAAITANKAADGKKSLCVVTSAGAAPSQYIFMPTEYFMPKLNRWVNIKVYVEPGKGPDYIRLFYKDASGPIVNSEYYYFADNKQSPVITDEIRKSGEWITLSHLMPASAKPLSFGVNFGTFGESNDNCKFYIDSYSITDTALDTLRYLDMNDPKVKASFESGTGADYIAQIQTSNWQREKYTAAVTAEKAQKGRKSLKIVITNGEASNRQYIFLNPFFKPQPGQWANVRVYIPNGSEPNALRFFYQGSGGPICYGEYYYFDDSPKEKVMTDEIRKKGQWVTISMQIPSGKDVRSFGICMEAFDDSNNATVYLDNYTLTNAPEDKIRYGAAEPKGNTLIDFESGSSAEYLYVVQNNEWRQPSAQTSAVTSYCAADGKRSLYYKNDNPDDSRVLLYFPTKYNPKEGRFLNVKVYVNKGNKGLDYAQLIYLQNGGQIVAGPRFSFANDKDNSIDSKELYKKGEWITLSLYIPKNSDLNRAGVQFGSYGNNGSNKEIFIDSYSYSVDPLDKTHEYVLKPLIDIPDNYSGAIKRIVIDPESLGRGINVSSGEKIKTSKGAVAAENLTLKSEVINDGDLFNKAMSSSGKDAAVLYKLSLFYENKEVNLAESIKLLLTVPKGIDETTAQVYYVDSNGKAELLKSETNNEILSVDVDRLGYIMIAGDKAQQPKLMFKKTITTGATEENSESGGLSTTWIILIAAGAVVLAGAAAVAIVFIIKKKKALSEFDGK